jgi:thiol-disulfide isomerase/thioredoxin
MFKPAIFSLTALLLALCSSVAPALAEKPATTGSKMETPNAANQPIVVVVTATWCPACKKNKGTVMGVMNDYISKTQWVILDVSTKKTTAEAEKKVKELGLEKFYAEYGARTSTVAILEPQTKKVLSVFMAEGRREKYVAALDKALVAQLPAHKD